MLCIFLPLPRLSLCMEFSSPFPHLGTVLQLSRSSQIKQALNVPRILQMEPVTLGSQDTIPASFLPSSSSFVVCLHAHELLQGRGHVWFISATLLPSPCAPNMFDERLKERNVHYRKIVHQSPVHQRCQEMFSSNVVSQCQILTLSWSILKHWKFRRASKG